MLSPIFRNIYCKTALLGINNVNFALRQLFEQVGQMIEDERKSSGKPREAVLRDCSFRLKRYYGSFFSFDNLASIVAYQNAIEQNPNFNVELQIASWPMFLYYEKHQDAFWAKKNNRPSSFDSFNFFLDAEYNNPLYILAKSAEMPLLENHTPGYIVGIREAIRAFVFQFYAAQNRFLVTLFWNTGRILSRFGSRDLKNLVGQLQKLYPRIELSKELDSAAQFFDSLSEQAMLYIAGVASWHEIKKMLNRGLTERIMILTVHGSVASKTSIELMLQQFNVENFASGLFEEDQGLVDKVLYTETKAVYSKSGNFSTTAHFTITPNEILEASEKELCMQGWKVNNKTYEPMIFDSRILLPEN